MIRTFPVPRGHEEAARAWLDGDRVEVVPPRQAATVVLVRDGDPEVEVFMLRRHLGMAFAGGMYVFPGGGVDPRDESDEVPWAGPAPHEWARELRTTPELARACVCAAVRETFEECGVLLAGEQSSASLCATDGEEWERDRQGLIAREVAMSDLLRRRGLALRSDLLRPWAHWTTPEHEPRRFDTRFFAAVMPSEQGARHVGGEADESGWWTATALLDRFARGEVLMMPPTLVTLEEVAAARSAHDLWGSERVVREVVPKARHEGDGVVLAADLPDQPATTGRSRDAS